MTDSEYLRCDVFLFSTLSDRASLQVQENGLAQAAVQAAAQGRGGLLQDDAALQHPRVKITQQTITRKPLNESKTQVVVTSSSPTRHRATNMFLDAYKRNWLETEGYSFEDKMIDDLSVSPSSSTDPKKAFMSMLLMHFFFFYIRKPWRKRRKRKRRPRRSLTPFISSFFTLAERPSQKRRNNHRLCFCSATTRLILTQPH